ncbi:MAG: riboflavin synthase [Hungatella sp.]|nr:riboflavin synthase [Hungatella sp.]
MFTGIVEEVGTVERIRKGRDSAVVTIHGKKVLEGTKVGDSIAVNGICLTVISLSGYGDSFSADVMHETLNRSSLAGLTGGSHVNLERAMKADGRFGGHMVAGHVDGIGRIRCIRRDDTAVWYTIQAGAEILRYVVEKGSVAIDGISLTVAKVSETDFSVSTIPHTLRETILQEKKEGDVVNLETDIIGKYVEKLLDVRSEPIRREKSKITREFLSRYEF